MRTLYSATVTQFGLSMVTCETFGQNPVHILFLTNIYLDGERYAKAKTATTETAQGWAV